MIYTQKTLNVLTAMTYKGVGKAWIIKHKEALNSEEGVISALQLSVKKEVFSVLDFYDRKQAIESQIHHKQEFMDGVISVADPEFPIHRGNVPNGQKPVVLFYKGDIALLEKQYVNMAVIGLLEPDLTTKTREEELIDTVVEKNIVVVSGLANGCDAIAHKQTLVNKGKTVAILPSPLHNILPKSNENLALDIVNNGGLLVTEYLNDAKSKFALTARYDERDRLQALFSDVVILAASYAKNNLGNDSGARLAMGYAKKYGIIRAVQYNKEADVNNPKYDLNRQLIHQDPSVIIIDQINAVSDFESLCERVIDEKSKPSQSSLF
jgi:DNA processing protein